MQKVLMISRDPKASEASSQVYGRLKEYARLLPELHVVVMGRGAVKKDFRDGNLFVYPAHSRFMPVMFLRGLSAAFFAARRCGKKSWVTVQDIESAVIAFVLAKIFGLKLQMQIHTDLFSPNFARGSRWNAFRVFFAKQILPYASSIRIVSEHIKASLQDKAPGLKAAIDVLPIFADMNKIRNHPVKFDFHKKYPQFNKIILVVARLEKEKNVEFAIEFFALYAKTHPQTGLVIVGSGSQESFLKQKAKSLELSGSVIFEGWVSDIASAYKTSDLLLVTSLYEGFGLAMLEASTTGLPVVATDVGIASALGARIIPLDAPQAVKAIQDAFDAGRVERDLSAFEMTKEEYLKKFVSAFA